MKLAWVSGNWRRMVTKLPGRGACVADSARTGLVNLLFPPVCSLCDVEMAGRPFGDLSLCPACRDLFVSQERKACCRCAAQLPNYWQPSDNCPNCRNRKKYRFDRAIALGDYRGAIRQAVLNMKRPAHEPLMRAVGTLLGNAARLRLGPPSIDLIVPVPMYWWRRIRRGTNTAGILARYAGRALQLSVADRLLFCRRKTKKQGTLLPSERARNVHHAFGVSAGYDITDKNILLVDDIMTTGATVHEAARALKRAGARSVAVAVVARGLGQQ